MSDLRMSICLFLWKCSYAIVFLVSYNLYLVYYKLKGEVGSYVKLLKNYFFHHRHISRRLRTNHTRFPIELPHDIVLRLFHVHFRYSRISKTANSLWLVPNGGIYIFNLCVRSELCLDLKEATTVNFRNTIPQSSPSRHFHKSLPKYIMALHLDGIQLKFAWHFFVDVMFKCSSLPHDLPLVPSLLFLGFH